MTLTKLLEEIEYISVDNFKNTEINNITGKIKEIKEETLFILTDGVRTGSSEIEAELLKSCPTAIIHDTELSIAFPCPTIKVKNARRCMAYLCSRLYEVDYNKTKFIGITGTNGKTTTATLIYEMLRRNGYQVGFIGTGKILYMDEKYSDSFYSMTTPDPELLYKCIAKMQKNRCKIIVMEVSSHSISLEKIAPIRFEYSIFTNLSPEHLDFHGTIDEYYKAKLKLFSQTKTGIFNMDDKFSARAMTDTAGVCEQISVGIVWESAITARDIILDGFKGASYLYRDEKRIFRVKLSLVGYYNVYNSLLALSCVIALGLPACRAKEALEQIKNIDGRFETYDRDVMVVIDYAHTPDAFENVLKTVNTLKKSWQNIITVFGCGGERDKEKRHQMGKIAEKYSSKIIVTEDNSRGEPTEQIISDIILGIEDVTKRCIITSRTEAINHAIIQAEDDDIILILGKGHERYTVNCCGIHEYDEREIVNSAFAKRNRHRILK